MTQIEKIKDVVQKGFNRAKECEEYDDDMYETGRADAYEDVLSFIESLEQEPEGELEKEIITYQRENMDRDTTVGNVARHFYELGLNARKEE